MSNSLLKYINNKGVGFGIDNVQESNTTSLPDPNSLLNGALVTATDENTNSLVLTAQNGKYVSSIPRRKTKQVAWMPNILGYVDSSNTFTYSMTVTAPCEFESVALIFQNQNTSSVTLTASVAVTESLSASKTVPKIDGVDYNSLATAGTQNGFIPVTSAGLSSIVIPANTDLFLTDQIPLDSIPRTDISGALPLVIARMYINAQQSSTYQFSNTTEVRNFGDNYMGSGVMYQYVQSGVEAVAAPGNWVQPATETLNMRIKGLVFYAKGQVQGNVLFIGDSIDHGLGGGGDTVTNNAGNTLQWGGRACLEMSTPSAPIGFISAGWSGKTSANFFARAKTLATLFKPTDVVFPAYTPNDVTNTKYGVQQALARVVDFIEYCYQNNINPICRLPVPYSGSGNETLRIEVINKVRSMGILILDMNTPLYDSSNTAGGFWKSALYHVDGTHPSQLSYALMKNQAKSLFKLIF